MNATSKVKDSCIAESAGDASFKDETPWPHPARGWWAAILLTLAMTVSYVDRSVLALLVEPVKASLGLTDVQIGLLQGITFGLVFTITMLPCGWLADNANRTKLLAMAIAVWSIMTAACGLAANFVQMFLARMGVAVGEATLSPSAPSLIADYFPPERRTPPLSLYGMGGATGTAASLLLGGAVATLVGDGGHVVIPGFGTVETWQVIFFSLAIPGLLLSVLFLIHREPQRRHTSESEGTFKELTAVVVSRWRILLPHMAGFCLYHVFAHAMTGWMPAYFMRVHGWSVAEVGVRMGVVQLTFGVLGALLGGFVARLLWRRKRRDANLLAAGLFLGLMVVPAVPATLIDNAGLSVALLGIMFMLLIAPGGPLLGTIQEVIPNRLRGRITAIYYIVLGFVAMTFGPLVIGVLNDHVFVDPRGVGKSLAVTALITLPLASGLMFLAGRARRRLDWAG